MDQKASAQIEYRNVEKHISLCEKYSILIHLGVDGKELICFYDELNAEIQIIKKNLEIQFRKNFEDFSDEELIIIGEKIFEEMEKTEAKFIELIKEKSKRV